jgi:hypothetical protein
MDLKELEAELLRVRRKAQDWATSRVQQAADCSDQHNAFIRDQTGRSVRPRTRIVPHTPARKRLHLWWEPVLSDLADHVPRPRRSRHPCVRAAQTKPRS